MSIVEVALIISRRFEIVAAESCGSAIFDQSESDASLFNWFDASSKGIASVAVDAIAGRIPQLFVLLFPKKQFTYFIKISIFFFLPLEFGVVIVIDSSTDVEIELSEKFEILLSFCCFFKNVFWLFCSLFTLNSSFDVILSNSKLKLLRPALRGNAPNLFPLSVLSYPSSLFWKRLFNVVDDQLFVLPPDWLAEKPPRWLKSPRLLLKLPLFA